MLLSLAPLKERGQTLKKSRCYIKMSMVKCTCMTDIISFCSDIKEETSVGSHWEAAYLKIGGFFYIFCFLHKKEGTHHFRVPLSGQIYMHTGQQAETFKPALFFTMVEKKTAAILSMNEDPDFPS